MENKDVEKIIEKNSEPKKVKGFAFDTTKLVSYAILLAVLVIVVVFSLIPVGFNWEEAFTNGQWWANFAILACLVIFGMIYGDSEGTIFLKHYEFGAFQVARNDFLDTVDKINNKKIRGLYADWLQFYNKKKRQRVYEELMYRFQINKDYFDVLTIPQDDFLEIKRNITDDKAGIVKVGDKFYKLNAKQWELCNSIRNGEIQVSTIDNDCYFLTENHNAMADDDKLVMRAVSQKFKNKFLVYGLRVVMLLAVSALLAGFFVDKSQTLTEQAWFSLISRLTTLLSGVSTGISTARQNNKIDVFVYKHKTDRNKEFMEDIEEKRYIPVSEQEKVQKEYEEQLKKQEEIVAAVVDEPVSETLPVLIDNEPKQE